MKNEVNKKPNLLELESLRSELIDKTLSTNSIFLKIFLYQNYFEKALYSDNPNIEEAFLKEFLDDYIFCISKLEVWGIEPGITKKLLEQIKKISALKITSENLTSLNYEVDRIEKQLEKLNLILDGKDFEDSETRKALFPLIDKDAPDGFYGIIESVTVRINKAVDVDKFIIVPSENEVEKKILEQCKKSWLLAIDLTKKFVKKPFKNHEVIISFDKKEGFYEGNSLGIALTLSLIEELLQFYNPTYKIGIKKHTAFTGGLTETGEVLCTSEEIIKQKIAAIFFSEINTFVFPKCEETYAYFALTRLKKTYPGRKLKLVPVEDINDVINRRDVVDIKKQKLIVQSGKFVKKNWSVVSLSIIILGLIYFANLWDFDYNPIILTNESNWLIVKNKNGKELWKKRMAFDISQSDFQVMPSITEKIVDIDSDGINEIILARENKSTEQFNKPVGRITCYSSTGEIIWENIFNDRIKSEEMFHSNDYFSMFVDTVTIDHKKALICFADNVLSPAAVYFLELQTGRRVGSVLWNTGHLHSGKVNDFNRDGNRELVMFGLNNAFKRVIVFSIDIDKINGKLPSSGMREFVELKQAEVNEYILLPNTDFTQILTGNYNTTMWGYIWISEDGTRINNFLLEGTGLDQKAILIEIDGNLNVTKIDPSLEFEIARDSLVSSGVLPLPYTHTEEYQKMLHNQIEYWDGKEFLRNNFNY